MQKNVLIDSSCWVDFFRGKNLPLIQTIQNLLQEDRVVINGVIYLEILRGCRSELEAKVADHLYEPLFFLELDKTDYRQAALMGQKMLKKGLKPPNTDLLIAQSALRYHCDLFHQDKDFDHIARFFPLKIFPIK